jgi:ABC-2 type transport system ATP-binding protein
VKPALHVAHLSHRFGARIALDDVSFTLQAGEFAVLLGPNGAGKTTLMSLISGLYHARGGEISVLGHSLQGEALAALKRIGVVFQLSTLDLDLSVRENLRYHASLHGLSSGEARSRMQAELMRLGIANRQAEHVRTLSGGLRRRVELARALIQQPRLLLLDEPTVGLDPASRAALLSHVRSLCEDQGIAALWATHLIDEVETSGRLLVLDQGRIAWSEHAAGYIATYGGLQHAFAISPAREPA